MGCVFTPEQVAAMVTADLPRDARALLAWAVPRAITADRLRGLPRMMALDALEAAAPGVDAARAAVVELSVKSARAAVFGGSGRRVHDALDSLQHERVLSRVFCGRRGMPSVYAFMPPPVSAQVGAGAPPRVVVTATPSLGFARFADDGEA